MKRKIGFYTKNKPGPVLIAFGGMHGNEPSGVIALKKVFQNLHNNQPDFHGKFYGIACNLGALSLKKRYINSDLNRIWIPQNLNHISIRSEIDKGNHEQFELREIYRSIHDIISNAHGPLHFIDLHTTSSVTEPFTNISDTLRNRELALKYPVPIVLGIDENLEGTILNYINELGHVALGFEAGQHEAQSSIENNEAFIWMTLMNIGCIEESNISKGHIYKEQLRNSTTNGKRIFEVKYKYTIAENEGFIMKSNYINFQNIKKNEQLASNQYHKIYAPKKGRIFMPLYQQQGSDGFFIIREINWFWLKVSTILRRWSFHKILPYLPGIKKSLGSGNALEVNKKIARWYVNDVFHLLGFRRKVVKNNHIIYIKRRHDIKGPDGKVS